MAEKIVSEYEKNGHNRCVIAIGGPSGSSKSTSAALIEKVINSQTDFTALHITLDAYHFSQDYLDSHYDNEGEVLMEHKGRFDSFDTDKLRQDLRIFKDGHKLSFPEYSRKLHNPVENVVECTAENVILILEGLWLLYDRNPWSEIAQYYDVKIFFNSQSDFREENSVARHLRGGRSQRESRVFYQNSDKPNEKEILDNLIDYDYEFQIDV